MKVKRSSKLMNATIILNIGFFIIFVTFQVHYYMRLNESQCKNLILAIIEYRA